LTITQNNGKPNKTQTLTINPKPMNIKKVGMYSVIIGTIAILAVQTANKTNQVGDVSTFIPSVNVQPSMANTPNNDKIAMNNCKEPNKAVRPQAVGITHYQYPEVYSNYLVKVGSQKLHKEAAAAFYKMQSAAMSEAKVKLTVISGFRSVNEQAGIVNSKRGRGMSDKTIYSSSSEPGYSEHHTGLAMDINSLDPSFGRTKEGKWLKSNAKRFGFEISFPESRPNGVSYEPWHIRYVAYNPSMFCWGSKLIK
jgi:zinc D-Ala-D-Ala carboxypeptidase